MSNSGDTQTPTVCYRVCDKWRSSHPDGNIMPQVTSWDGATNIHRLIVLRQSSQCFCVIGKLSCNGSGAVRTLDGLANQVALHLTPSDAPLVAHSRFVQTTMLLPSRVVHACAQLTMTFADIQAVCGQADSSR